MLIVVLGVVRQDGRNDKPLTVFALLAAPPLALDNVLVAVSGVHWRTFGRELIGEWYTDDAGVMQHMDEIDNIYESDDACLKAVVDRFLKSHNPLWRKVIFALYKANAIHLAEYIRSYAEPLEGVLEISPALQPKWALLFIRWGALTYT